jgi:hypothetical protein
MRRLMKSTLQSIVSILDGARHVYLLVVSLFRSHANANKTIVKLNPQYFTKQLSVMSTFASQWMLVFLAAMAMVQSVCFAASSTSSLSNGVFVLKQVVVNSTDVPFTERYTMTFQPTNDTEWDVYIHIANNMWSTMEIDSAITTVHNDTILSVAMLPGGSTLMMPYGEAADVEFAVVEILPGITTVLVEEKKDELTVTFLAGNGTSILILEQELS